MFMKLNVTWGIISENQVLFSTITILPHTYNPADERVVFVFIVSIREATVLK